MDRYEARVTLHGTTQRERNVNRFRDDISSLTLSNPSYKSILLNGEKTHIIINTGTKPYYKEFQGIPGQKVKAGDYIDFAGGHWIVVNADFDDEITCDGEITQCEYLLRWQNECGEIIERWAVITSASKYNDGTDGNNVITLGSDQISVAVSVDDETIKLKKEMSKKFFIDNNKLEPTVYELTGDGNVPNTYDRRGVTSWILKECAFTLTKKDLEHGICDYKEPSPTPDVPPNQTVISSISGRTELYLGRTMNYTASFIDKSTNEPIDCDFTWNIVSEFSNSITQTIDGNIIKLRVADEDYIDSSFLLQVIVDKVVYAAMQITVVGLI